MIAAGEAAGTVQVQGTVPLNNPQAAQFEFQLQNAATAPILTAYDQLDPPNAQLNAQGQWQLDEDSAVITAPGNSITPSPKGAATSATSTKQSASVMLVLRLWVVLSASKLRLVRRPLTVVNSKPSLMPKILIWRQSHHSTRVSCQAS
ncbi:MAG: hypothetical protein HC926_03945 [Synechococcaceae cyanobacterium SM2_3_60]|nr:hypothetical protein [Synechococcaceae cyanobacterium SM2_3_60]